MKKNLLSSMLRPMAALAVALFAGAGMVYADNGVEVEEVIMQRIREAEWEKVENVSELDADVAGLLSTLQADGSWADIPYSSTAQTNWEPISHLDRLKKLALAYTLSTSAYAGNSELHAKSATP
jgi:hypothetical protein